MKELPTLFKIKRKRYVDQNGKRCKKADQGATEIVDQSADWYADIPVIELPSQRIARKKADRPKPKAKRVKLCVGKRAAQKMLAQLVDSEERKSAGLKDYHSFANQSLGELVTRFEQHLEITNRTKSYIGTTVTRIETTFGACGIIRLADIDCDKIGSWLSNQQQKKASPKPSNVKGTARNYEAIAEAFQVNIHTVTYWRNKGAPIVPRQKNSLTEIAKWHAEYSKPSTMSSATRDHYVTALKAFGNWMVKPAKVIEKNPFDDLVKLHDSGDTRKKRRAVSDSDFAKLVNATKQSPKTIKGLTGYDRSILYQLAAYTGLRASEIASLTSDSICLDGTATVSVDAAYTKNGEQAEIPLRSDLAELLQTYIQNKTRPTLSMNPKPIILFPSKWCKSGRKDDPERLGSCWTSVHCQRARLRFSCSTASVYHQFIQSWRFPSIRSGVSPTF